jgi:hypothetical protein
MGKFIKVSRDDLFNADSKAKREALEKAYADIGLTKPTAQTSWERDPKLKAFLKSLG